MRLATTAEGDGAVQNTARHRQIEQTAYAVLDGQNVLVSGSNGMGRSTFLAAVSATLTVEGRTTRTVSCHDPDMVNVIAQTPRDDVLLVDDLEHAGCSALQAIYERHLHDGVTVSMLNSSSTMTPYAQNISRIAPELHRGSAHARPVVRITMERLSDADMQRLIHGMSASPLDAVTVQTIGDVAEGRPAWAVDLVKLACSGAMREPAGVFAHLTPEHLGLRSVQRVRQGVGTLSKDVAALGIVLSEIEPLDRQSLNSLVGEHPTATLIRHGVLVEHRDGVRLAVPRFVATILKAAFDPATLPSARSTIAQALAALSASGVPISSREKLFCVLNLSLEAMSTHGTSILRDVIRECVDFGDVETLRAIKLKWPTLLGERDPALEARTQAVFHRRVQAVETLSRAASSAGSSASFEDHFLRQLLSHGSDGSVPTRLSDPPLGVHPDEVLIAELWNTKINVSDYETPLSDIAAHHPVEEVAAAAQALRDLSAVWNARTPDDSSWLSRGAPLPVLRATGFDEYHDLRHTVVIAHALTLSLSGELTLRAHEIEAQLDALPAPRREHLWFTHLKAAYEALLCGDPSRASIEWECLMRRLPKFLPHRLRSYLLRIGEIIALVSSPALEQGTASAHGTEVSSPFYRLALYLSGKLHGYHHAATWLSQHDSALPLVKTAQLHLHALDADNPADLMRVADRFFALGMWVPSARAYASARQIYTRRRSSTKAQYCGERLAVIEQELHERVAWHPVGQLTTGQVVTLTPREEEVAGYIARGLSNKEVAAELGCTVRTIESHVASARAKLGASNRHELARMYSKQEPESTALSRSRRVRAMELQAHTHASAQTALRTTPAIP